MNVSLNPTVAFRRRNGWEAADMGIFLWRNNWFPIFLFLGIPAGILFVLDRIMVNLNIEWAYQAMTGIIWWLKPLLDRFCLQVVSVRFFNSHSSLRQLFRGLGKTLRTGLAGDLLWRRFSPYRSAHMPLLVLEQLKGKNYKHRKKLLYRNGLGFGLLLTLVCIGIIAALNMGVLIFLQGISGQIMDDTGSFLDFFNNRNILVSVLFFFNLVMIESLYVCMGFSLYINARVETEGWDIELLFKSCVERLIKPRTVVFAVILLIFLFAPMQSAASDNVYEQFQPNQISEEAQEIINSIYGSSDFGQEKPGKTLRFKQSGKPTGDLFNPFLFPSLKEILGLFLRFVLGAALAAALIIGIVYAYRRRNRLFPGLFGGKSRFPDETAPDEPWRLLEQAGEHHRKGRIREAWALCFRAYIAAFTGVLFFSLPPEATEYEILALIRQNTAGADLHRIMFSSFVNTWVGFAYGGREPPGGSFEDALVSCRTMLENNSGKLK
ncbi:MAG: hypothetical protein LBH42_03155 [Treponema sp.]|jgi:hypothetical protein|nr:hypothetical protein [Treponema sp.]